MQVCNLRMVQLLFLFCLLLFFISKQFYPTPIFFALYYVSSIFQGLRFHFQRMGVCIADFFITNLKAEGNVASLRCAFVSNSTRRN